MSWTVTPAEKTPVDKQGISNVSLLLHGNGTNGSTTITDSSPTPKTVTAFGNAQISTAQSKFGGASISFNGLSTSYIKTPLSSEFDLFGSDFTIEGWFYYNSTSLAPHLFNIGTATNRRVTLYTASSALRLYTQTSVSNADRITSSTLLAINTWYHVSITKSSGTWQLWLNGVSQGTSTTDVFPTGNLEVAIGTQNYGVLNADAFNGYADEIRITKGVARYTSNFSVPPAPFPDI